MLPTYLSPKRISDSELLQHRGALDGAIPFLYHDDGVAGRHEPNLGRHRGAGRRSQGQRSGRCG